MNYILSTTSITIFLINTLGIIFFLYLSRKNPQSTLSWILAFTLVPIFGFVIYLYLGKEMSNKNLVFLREEEERLKTKIQSKLNERDKCSIKDTNTDIYNKYADVILMNYRQSKAHVNCNNDVDILIDGQVKFKSLIEDFRNAKIEINIQYFIYKKSKIGDKIKEELIKKCKEGVKVRVLIDDFGSQKIPRNYFDDLVLAGGEVSVALKMGHFLKHFNNRNHRKIVVIDREIAYTGGYNIGDEYCEITKERGYWRDTHIRITGPSVSELLLRFFIDWKSAGNPEIELKSHMFVKEHRESLGSAMIQIVSSGPDKELKDIKMTYMELINRATKSICIETPYFIPDAAFFECVQLALIRGVKVEIIIPDKKDHIFVYWATYSFIGDLLPLGLKAYKYLNGFMHSKTLIIDDEVLSVGSANFDQRSFSLSFETNCFVYNREVAYKYRASFNLDLENSEEITMEAYKNRSLLIKLKEPVCRIFAPLL